MSPWLWAVDVLLVVVVLTALALVGLVLRRRRLTRRLGAFDLSINKRAEASAHGWTLGVAAYRGHTLRWYRTFSVRFRPAYVWDRRTMVVEGRRVPEGAEMHALHDGHLIVTTRNRTPVQQLALSPDALTGLLAWLEAAPPGESTGRVL